MQSEERLVVGRTLQLFDVCFGRAKSSARQRPDKYPPFSGYSTHCLGETPQNGATDAL